MPMSFPDMDSLTRAAEVHKFRPPVELETEEEYRNALADHVASRLHRVAADPHRQGLGPVDR